METERETIDGEMTLTVTVSETPMVVAVGQADPTTTAEEGTLTATGTETVAGTTRGTAIEIEIEIEIVIVIVIEVVMIASMTVETTIAGTTAGEMQVDETAVSVVLAETEMGEGIPEERGTVVATTSIAREMT